MRTPPPGASYSTINYAQGKSKKVAWFVSNCHGPNGRGAYVAELEKFVHEVLLYALIGLLFVKNHFVVFFL
jgi:hypothetical protein